MHFDGVNWNVVPSPNLGTSSSLNSMVVLAADDLWASGSYFSGTFHTFVLHYDGVTWTVVPTPNIGSQDSALSGLTAVSATNCGPVGYYHWHLGSAPRWRTSMANWTTPSTPSRSGAIASMTAARSPTTYGRWEL
jgi:hypothetical protein